MVVGYGTSPFGLSSSIISTSPKVVQGAPSTTRRSPGISAIALRGPPIKTSIADPVTPTPFGLPDASNETTATDAAVLPVATKRPAADPSLGGGTASRIEPN